jgi:hypothetical protein
MSQWQKGAEGGPDPAVAALAHEILDLRMERGRLPTLVLGDDFACIAGTPPPHVIARTVLRRFRTRYDRRRDEYYEAPIPRDDDAVVEAFLALLREMPAADRGTLALRVTGSLPVPQFAEEMALLVRDRCFSTIVTTSFDSLVERALDGVGMAPERDYEIVDLLDRPADIGAAPVTIVKAYAGHLERSDAMADALDAECVVVGPGSGHRSLIHGLANPGGQLWWVSQAPLQPHEERAYSGARDFHHVGGPAGDPDRFFAELSLWLLQMPSLVVQRAYDEGAVLRPARETELRATSARESLASLAGSSYSTEPETKDFERLLLESRIDRCRDALRRLERRGGGVVGDEALDAQLGYQREQLALLEEHLYALADSHAELLHILGQVRASAAPGLDPATSEYFDSLIARVGDELKRPEPNDAIVGASVGAAAVLADRAGVEPSLVRRLANSAPGSSIRLGP